ncbi:NAD(P)/FAD-dependent oxidoreductase [Rhodococcus jostii]|uniref:FAD-dependent oxidoreductase n=1 Tax=Rhodococcus jostii TaxID=132919 RepID=A0ABU4CU13_RHOJO|nr:FAD-dependent oxidoreductase [Rhodococcus jostii]MDV6286983.1 FAD-dependent oxidoreductase [Rhodococcus jostii]
MTRTVIVGAGVAGVQTALELRHRGYAGDITLISEDMEEPYDRPPLSKEFLKGSVGRDTLGLLPAQTASERAITMRLGSQVSDLRTSEQQVVLSDGSSASYDYLVLATGAHNRPLPVPGADLPGVWSLRGLDEAEGLRSALADAVDVVIVGGGFIGLEVAAVAQAHGARVTVVEFLPRVMARVLSDQMSQHFAEEHRSRGVEILTGVGVTEVVAGLDGTASSVTLSDGTVLPADLVVVGVGVLPATELAVKAGLHTSDGIVVDEQLRTSDSRIYAVGDCARFNCVVTGRDLRLESIQNAADQARFVAAQIASMSEPSSANSQTPSYAALPWFWTEQYNSKLQIAGVAPLEADSVVRGDPTSGSFSVCRFVGERLVAVESVNQARDHLGARKLLAANSNQIRRVTRAAVADITTALKTLLDV